MSPCSLKFFILPEQTPPMNLRKVWRRLNLVELFFLTLLIPPGPVQVSVSLSHQTLLSRFINMQLLIWGHFQKYPPFICFTVVLLSVLKCSGTHLEKRINAQTVNVFPTCVCSEESSKVSNSLKLFKGAAYKPVFLLFLNHRELFVYSSSL